jgi:6-phosphogluconate dehydrogenase
VDAVTKELLDAGIAADDIVVDCGNSLWTDTIRRERDYAAKCKFFGSGVSGGEVGARFGPSMMPGGDPESWKHLKPIWEAVAAKVDAKSRQAVENYAPGKPVTGGVPVHGVPRAQRRRALRQDGAQRDRVHRHAAHLRGLHADAEPARHEGPDMSKVFASGMKAISIPTSSRSPPTSFSSATRCRRTGTSSITCSTRRAEGHRQVDERAMRWTWGSPRTRSRRRCLRGACRALRTSAWRRASSFRAEVRGAQGGRSRPHQRDPRCALLLEDLRVCPGLSAHARGAERVQWKLNFAEIAAIWRGGCIIRARFLQKITDAYTHGGTSSILLLDPYFNDQIKKGQGNWRRWCRWRRRTAIAAPPFMSALAYYDGYRAPRLPANLLQAQRDYFGAHTYERTDQPRGHFFHLDWPEPGRPQIAIPPAAKEKVAAEPPMDKRDSAKEAAKK